jgi:hypothetical protein
MQQCIDTPFRTETAGTIVLCRLRDTRRYSHYYSQSYQMLMMAGIKPLSGNVLYAPLVLFYLAKNNTLLPLAIQLTRDPQHNEVYTPYDKPEVIHSTISSNLFIYSLDMAVCKDACHDGGFINTRNGSTFVFHSLDYGTCYYSVP